MAVCSSVITSLAFCQPRSAHTGPLCRNGGSSVARWRMPRSCGVKWDAEEEWERCESSVCRTGIVSLCCCQAIRAAWQHGEGIESADICEAAEQWPPPPVPNPTPPPPSFSSSHLLLSQESGRRGLRRHGRTLEPERGERKEKRDRGRLKDRQICRSLRLMKSISAKSDHI